MVKISEKAPEWKNIANKDMKKILWFLQNPEIQGLIEKTDRLYYYWDKIRAQPISKELDKKEIWAFIRFRRYMNSSFLPVLDVKKRPFSYWLPDDIQKNLHLIDQSMGGNLAAWDPGNDTKASTKYMISSLMEEAITSSQIEGAVATIKEAKKMLMEQRKPKNQSEQMIYNNFLTMQSVKAYCKKDLDIPMLLELHLSITKDTLDEKEEEGRFRKAEDKVRIEANNQEVLFIPPPAEEIEERLQALLDFANDKNEKPFFHPVVKAIVLHFWMAYIHPFTDGNGRMARTLFYWYMLKHQYWLFEYTSISKSIIKSPAKYAAAYLYSEHDDNDLTYFIHFHVAIIMDAIAELKKYIETEREKKQKILLEIANHPDLNIRQTRLLQYFRDHPNNVLTIKTHQNINGIAYQSARTDLLELEKQGWLQSVKKKKTFYYIPAEGFWGKFEK